MHAAATLHSQLPCMPKDAPLHAAHGRDHGLQCAKVPACGPPNQAAVP